MKKSTYDQNFYLFIQEVKSDVGAGMGSTSAQSIQDQSDRIEATLMQLDEKLKQKTQAAENLKKSQSVDTQV